MAMMLGGRAAEEIVFGEPTTGASDDIERCTDLARKMVTMYGMSDRLGPLALGSPQQEVFVGKGSGEGPSHSDEVAGQIDHEVRRLVDEAHHRAQAILVTHRATLDRLAHDLVDKETLDDGDLAEIFGPIDKGAGIELPVRRGSGQHGDWGWGDRVPAGSPVLNATAAEVDRARAVRSVRSSWRQRARRWLGAERSPRPSGT
jgi:Peptidase family M41